MMTVGTLIAELKKWPEGLPVCVRQDWEDGEGWSYWRVMEVWFEDGDDDEFYLTDGEVPDMTKDLLVLRTLEGTEGKVRLL